MTDKKILKKSGEILRCVFAAFFSPLPQRKLKGVHLSRNFNEKKYIQQESDRVQTICYKKNHIRLLVEIDGTAKFISESAMVRRISAK